MTQHLTREYSKRLGTLSFEQLQSALDRFGLGKLLAAEPATTGLFGQNIFLSTTAGEYVLRGAPHPPWQLAKERFITKLIHERTDVPVPWPFTVDESGEIFGWPYAIMPCMPGLDVGNPQVREGLSRAERISLARAMGGTLARLHRLTWPQCGEYAPRTGAIEPIDTSFGDWLASRIRAWFERSRAASSATTDVDAAWVERVIGGGRGALDVPFSPSLVHHDYKENNAVATPAPHGWRVTGLFDVGGGYFGDGEEDLCRSIATYAREDVALARAFVAGYRDHGTLRPGHRERFPLYMLMDRLVIWEYGQRNNVWFQNGVSLREYVEPLTRLDPW